MAEIYHACVRGVVWVRNALQLMKRIVDRPRREYSHSLRSLETALAGRRYGDAGAGLSWKKSCEWARTKLISRAQLALFPLVYSKYQRSDDGLKTKLHFSRRPVGAHTWQRRQLHHCRRSRCACAIFARHRIVHCRLSAVHHSNQESPCIRPSRYLFNEQTRTTLLLVILLARVMCPRAISNRVWPTSQPSWPSKKRTLSFTAC